MALSPDHDSLRIAHLHHEFEYWVEATLTRSKGVKASQMLKVTP